jgi:hypothetical protein
MSDSARRKRLTTRGSRRTFRWLLREEHQQIQVRDQAHDEGRRHDDTRQTEIAVDGIEEESAGGTADRLAELVAND